jgi:hypothetical protein
MEEITEYEKFLGKLFMDRDRYVSAISIPIQMGATDVLGIFGVYDYLNYQSHNNSFKKMLANFEKKIPYEKRLELYERLKEKILADNERRKSSGNYNDSGFREDLITPIDDQVLETICPKKHS